MNKILQGDCLEVLKTLPDNSVDSIVTDPPYGLGFMNKEWDSPARERELLKKDKLQRTRKTGRVMANPSPLRPGMAILGAEENRKFQAWCYEWAKECLRILKPGGYLLSFGATRMYHRMASGIEDAGFTIRDQIGWTFGSGFPKSLNLKGKYQGWGTALKPAWEPIVMARKALEGTVEQNVKKYSTGAINIDASRVGTEKISVHNAPKGTFAGGDPERGSDTESYREHQGRWPANLIHDGSEEVVSLFPRAKGGAYPKERGKSGVGFAEGKMPGDQPAHQMGDDGSAARFFYCAKTSAAERNFGLENMGKKIVSDGREKSIDNPFLRGETERRNTHPTVKPLALMSYLIKLVTPPKGVVLDPFAGSASTLIAAKQLGYSFIGIEKEEEYIKIAEARLKAVPEKLL